MKTIIAGSRTITDMKALVAALDDYGLHSNITQVISGTARGVDSLGEEWAKSMGIPLVKMPADWDKHGKRAGYLRNEEMACVADFVLVLWDGSSKGAAHMVDIAEKKGVPHAMYEVDMKSRTMRVSRELPF